MYTSKRLTKKLTKQFERDNALGLPFHKSDEQDANRNAFLKQLMSSKDFVTTYKQNDKRFAEPLRETIKKFKTFEYIVIALTTIGGTVFTYQAATGADFIKQKVEHKRDIYLALFTLLGLLGSFGFGSVCAAALLQESRDSSIGKMYNRLSVRLFDLMRETYPNLDENILKACNPEMARVIKALLMANMPESDTREIIDLSIKISKQLRELPTSNAQQVLTNCNTYIKQAISVIEQNLLTNPGLHDAILAVYRGNVPARFVIQNNQNTK